MREWLTVIVVLLIIGVLLDGWRRMRNARRDSLRMGRATSYRSESPREATDDAYTSELPNGGARVIAYREPPPDPAPQIRTPASRKPAASGPRIPEQVTLNLDEAVPLLMESVEESQDPLPEDYAESADAEETYGERIEPSFTALDDDDFDEQSFDQKPFDEKRLEQRRPQPTSPEGKPAPARSASGAGYEERISAREAEPAKAPAEPEEVLIINVMAPEGERFVGSALLEVVLHCGMRYGDMNIFHRHTDTKGNGPILYSMANMVHPGTFDLDTMDEFATPGVSLFMTLPLDADSSIQAFDLMVSTAQALSESLGGELKDENRSVMTRQTMEHCRQRIRDFERRQLSRTPH